MTFGATPREWFELSSHLGLTSDLLPVVSNPKATIAPTSTLKQLGKTPSLYNANRQVVGLSNWTQRTSTDADIDQWIKEPDYGICIQTRAIRALDVDVEDAGVSDRVLRHLADAGMVIRRTRANSPKFLVAFRLRGEFTKRRLKVEGGYIEFLGNGQQFVACGTHPSGARYEWAGGLPDEFPTLTPDEFEALWRELEQTFGVEPAAESSASVRRQKLSAVLENDRVAQQLMSRGLNLRVDRSGRIDIVCPWKDDHTSESSDSQTSYFPANTNGYARGHFHCFHAHCEHRTDQEFRDALGIQTIDSIDQSEFRAIADADPGRERGSDSASGSDRGSSQLAEIPGGVQPAGDEPAPIRDESPRGDKPARKRFALIQPSEFVTAQPVEWLIKGVIPKAQVGLLFGESGSGKSFMALDFAMCIATGTPWRGRKVKQGRVVYLAAEGAGGFRKRLQAAAERFEVALSDLPLWVITDIPNMLEKKDALELAAALHGCPGGDPVLVVLDTFAQITAGANENSGEDMGRALAHCAGLHTSTNGGMVLLVHHAGKDSSKGARGWSGLRAAADCELEVVRADDRRSVTVTKQKDGGDGEEFGFYLDQVMMGFDADGEEITTCVVRHTEGDGPVRRQDAPKGAVERVIMATLDDLTGVTNEPVAVGEVLARAKDDLPVTNGKRDHRNFRLHRALEALIEAGRLAVVEGRIQRA